ncbi:unnamed protein product [Brachionus calyciflorus]|uniref:Dual specificity protein phosphatase n=1 Tax=Brachionus calyciflorus TaxID=104777 RepID=A0A813M7N1_9BILA|nr:unnamed protein product [Brachionus calyciflorus]
MSEKEKRVKELRKILFDEAKKQSIHDPINCLPKNKFDEVFENCFLGDIDIAQDKSKLKELGITYVLNAAKGEKFSQINTNQSFYNDSNIKFLGFNLMDVDTCKIEAHFIKATDFINEALRRENGKILVHCFMGVSRSASFVLAYLIKYKNKSLEDAIRLVFVKRIIWPNDGFLLKLIEFEEQIFNE